MSTPALLLVVWAGTRRYLVPHAHIDQIRRLDGAALPAHDERGLPLLYRALGDLLEPEAPPVTRRRQVLLVRLRRRSVALLVERVAGLAETGALTRQPLPALISRSLAQPWFLHVAIDGDEPLLVLDLRRIAADIAFGVVPSGNL